MTDSIQTPTNHKEIIALIKRISGQANFIGTPRIYVDMLEGDLVAAVWWNQVIYWDGKTSEPIGFYKVAQEWEAELGLSPFQVRRVSKLCERIGIVNITNRKVYGTPKLHYLVIWPAFMDLLTSTINKLNSPKITEDFPTINKLDSRETPQSESEDSSKSMECKETQDSLTENQITANNDIDIKILKAWDGAKEYLKGNMARSSYEEYLRGARLLNFADGILEIEAQSETAREWLSQRAKRSAENYLIGALNEEVSITFLSGGIS